MTPNEIRDLEARAEEYVRSGDASIDDGYRPHEHTYIAGARAQHEITRKATIDEVLRERCSPHAA